MGVQLKKGERILGIPAVKARNVLRHWNGDAAKIGGRSDVDLSPITAAALLSEFKHRGLIGTVTDPYGYEVKGITEAGAGFAGASGRARTPIERAKVALSELLANVERTYKDPDFPYRIRQIWVYGSFVRGETEVGDVDLAFDMVLQESFSREIGKAVRFAEEKGWNYRPSIFPDAAAVDYLFRHALFAGRRSPLFSLGTVKELINLGTPCKLVYDAGRGVVDDPIQPRHPESPGRSNFATPPRMMPELAPGGAIGPVDVSVTSLGKWTFQQKLSILDDEEWLWRILYHLSEAEIVRHGDELFRSLSNKPPLSRLRKSRLDGSMRAGLAIVRPQKRTSWDDPFVWDAECGVVFRRGFDETATEVTYELVVEHYTHRRDVSDGAAALSLAIAMYAAIDIERIARRQIESGQQPFLKLAISGMGQSGEFVASFVEELLRRSRPAGCEFNVQVEDAVEDDEDFEEAEELAAVSP